MGVRARITVANSWAVVIILQMVLFAPIHRYLTSKNVFKEICASVYLPHRGQGEMVRQGYTQPLTNNHAAFQDDLRHSFIVLSST